MSLELKEFLNNLPSFEKIAVMLNFEQLGLTIYSYRDGIIIKYKKMNNNDYCAMVFNPIQYEEEIKKAKQEIFNKLDVDLLKINKILKKDE